MSIFECSICCSQLRIVQRMICPNCAHEFCLGCQRQYARDDCMYCHMKFKQSFIVEHLGKKFMDTVIKPKIVESLMSEQKDTLKYVQPLVDWEKTVREQKKNLRFGIRMTVPERPKISTLKMNNMVFPCPIKECRGFIENGICGVCKVNICLKCREKMDDNHVCKIEDIQSIAFLMGDSKPCPRCCAIIHRTQGCNHMYCTNCCTHFDWNTLAILNNSSNGHYLHLQRFSQNVPVRDVPGANVAPGCTDGRGFSLYRDRVAVDELDINQLDKKLVQCIWNDSNSIRFIKRKKYNEQDVETVVGETLQELQVKYLMGDITETQWSRQVYQYSTKKAMALLYGDVLNIYLSTIDLFQLGLTTPLTREPISEREHFLPNLKEQEHLFEQYTKLVELCNESFNSIQEEYGGPQHHIRCPNEDFNAPAFV